MSKFSPSPFNTAMYLLVPTYEKVKGVLVKTYPEPTKGVLIYGSFKTYGGTESNKDGLYSVIDTANIETWYRPEIKADCRIVLVQQLNKYYEIMGEPENINMCSKYLKFKVQAIVGGA